MLLQIIMFLSQMLSHLLQDNGETTYEKLRNAKMPHKTEPIWNVLQDTKTYLRLSNGI